MSTHHCPHCGEFLLDDPCCIGARNESGAHARSQIALPIDREKLALNKYARWAKDLTTDQLLGLLGLIGEFSYRARPGDYPLEGVVGADRRKVAALRALARFNSHPLTDNEARRFIRAAMRPKPEDAIHARMGHLFKTWCGRTLNQIDARYENDLELVNCHECARELKAFDVDDNLERANCPKFGYAGHRLCGYCEEHNKPRTVCFCLAPLAEKGHDPA